ncbi:hypothetical protein R1flu_029303 [Riccia fluitans]|uniref:Xylose isomerase n=1 Tax=Riccia fluitans TaxID=41844 RepID=A0ABD1XP48_9MARC
MKDWLRFCVAFWHSFRGDGGDPFGSPTRRWPWEDGTNSLEMAKTRIRANFEFLRKLGVEYWCFHGRDIAPEGATLQESNKNLDELVALAKKLQICAETWVKKGRTYGHYGELRSYLSIPATCMVLPQVQTLKSSHTLQQKTMEVTHELGGGNCVFWGGREGYQSLLNTDKKKELNHMGSFLKAAAAWKNKIGFEDTTGMPQRRSVSYKNIECNHSTLAGHNCVHELEVARINGFSCAIKNGGLAPGGFNFDAKLCPPLSTYSLGLVNAAKLYEDGVLTGLVTARYASFDSEIGAQIEAGTADFETLEKYAFQWVSLRLLLESRSLPK